MTTLWNPKKPLTQPPGYGRTQGCDATHKRYTDEQKAAAAAIFRAQSQRNAATARVGGRRAVVSV